MQVVGGSLLMLLGVGAIAFASAGDQEQQRWRKAAERESLRYGVAADYVAARFEGRQATDEAPPRRTLLDWLLVVCATSILLAFAAMARVPEISVHWLPALVLTVTLVLLLLICGAKLWRTTRFH
jgi:hypothetical protein